MRVLVAYHSLHGNTYKMARAVTDGARTVAGAEVTLARIADHHAGGSDENDERVKNARILQKEIPLVKVEDLPGYNAIILGSPSRYGNMAAPVAHFLEGTAALWSKGALEGRIAGVFTCSATAYGAADAALLSMIVPLLHLGFIIAGVPHTMNAEHAIRAVGSPYGACALVGPNADRAPVDAELRLARALGHRIASLSRIPMRQAVRDR
jgi:NAD(P)H dehydrogenase (quinone)